MCRVKLKVRLDADFLVSLGIIDSVAAMSVVVDSPSSSTTLKRDFSITSQNEISNLPQGNWLEICLWLLGMSPEFER